MRCPKCIDGRWRGADGEMHHCTWCDGKGHYTPAEERMYWAWFEAGHYRPNPASMSERVQLKKLRLAREEEEAEAAVLEERKCPA